MIRTLTFALLISAAACGGKDKGAPATPASHEHPGEGSGEMMEHENLSPEMKAFHDLLAPRWHAAKGPQRMQDTCSAIEQFKASADAVAKATPPIPANADTWTAGTRALVAAVEELAKACPSGGDFEAAFAKVHEAFHSLMMQGAHHGEGHMEGKGGGEGPEEHEHGDHAEHGEESEPRERERPHGD